MIKRSSAVALPAITGALLLAPQALAATLNPATPPCGQPFDAYTYTAAAVRQCGYLTYPLTSTDALPGGGAKSTYDTGNGSTASMIVPPQGFDLASATAAQIQEYGLPPRPKNPAYLTAWENLQVGPAPPFLDASPTWNYGGQLGSDDASKHLAGYMVTAPTGYFTSASVSWKEPSYGPSACAAYDPEADIWAGVGAEEPPWPAQPHLGQDGTSLGGFSRPHEMWWEIFPVKRPIDLGLQVPANNIAEAWVQYDSSLPGYEGWVKDVTNAEDGITPNIETWQWTAPAGSQVSDYYSGDGADAFVERPAATGSPPNTTPTRLANFQTFTVFNSYGNGTSFGSYPDQGSGPELLHNVTMFNDVNNEPWPHIGPWDDGVTPLLASTPNEPIGSDGSFSLMQYHCGTN